MDNKVSTKAAIVGMICFFGMTVSQAALAEHSSCRAAYAFQSNSFGDCSATLSLSATGSSSSTKKYASRVTMQVAMAVTQYNEGFATNYAQRMDKGQFVATRNLHGGLRLATSLPIINCQSHHGQAKYLCSNLEIALSH